MLLCCVKRQSSVVFVRAVPLRLKRMQVTWCKVCYLRRMWGTMIHQLSWEGYHIDMLWFAVWGHALSCKYPTSAVWNSELFFLIPIHVVKFHSKNWNLLLCLLLNAIKHFASHKSCFHRLSSCGATWPLCLWWLLVRFHFMDTLICGALSQERWAFGQMLLKKWRLQIICCKFMADC